MAVDPNDLAQEQDRQQRLMAAGEPQTVAVAPEQQGIQVAGAGREIGEAILKALTPMFAPPVVPTSPKTQTMPTPQELPLKGEGFDAEAQKRQMAQDVLSPQGQAEFEARGFQAKPDETQQAVRSAQEALGEIAQDEFTQIEEMRAAREEQAAPSEYETTIEKANKAIEGEVPEAQPLEDVVLPEIDAQAKSIAEGGDFNLEYMKTSDDVKKLITAVSEVSKLGVDQAKRLQVPNNITKENAAELLSDELGFTKNFLERRIKDGLLTAEELVAAREVFVAQGERIMKLAEKINGGAATPADRLDFRRQLAIFHGVHLHLKGFQAETGRALQSFQIEVGGEEGALAMSKKAREALAELGGEEVTDQMAAAAAQVFKEKGIGGLSRFINKAALVKTKALIAEAYLAGMLTSTGTMAKNVFSGAAWLLYQLPEEFIAGVYGTAIRGGRQALGMKIDPDQVYLEDAALRVKGWYDSFGDALSVASLAFKTEKPSVMARAEVKDYASGFRLDEDTPFSGPINFLAKAMRLPFRALLFGDEFFKTISNRGELYVQANKAYREALYAGKDVIEAMDEAGMVLLDPASVSKELDMKAKYDTLQDDATILGYDISKPGTAIQRFSIGGLPVGLWLMPFVKTPTSSMVKTMEMSGINPDIFKQMFSGTPKQQQRAMAKYTMAAGAMMFVQGKVAEGRITGAMPMDEGAREALPPSWQPYSLVYKAEGWPEGVDAMYDEMGNPNGPLRYISYAGWEPVGGVLAFMTTANEAIYGNPDSGYLQRGIAVVGAIGSYYAELPMLEGLADLSSYLKFDTPADLFRNAPHLFRGPIEASSIVGLPNPYSAAWRMGARIQDPTTKDPFGDFEYYTMDEVTSTNEDGSWKYPHPDGVNPDYRLVGREKLGRPVRGGEIHVAEELSLMLEKIKAMRAKDSAFVDEDDYNITRFDTLGRPYGSEDVSFATNPVAALFNNFSGIRIRTGEKPTDVEIELSRLQKTQKVWPLSNPESWSGEIKGERYSMKLSNRAQQDLVNEAKNIIELDINGLGDGITFQKALEFLMTKTNTTKGEMYQDDANFFGSNRLVKDAKRLAMIKEIEQKYYDAAWQKLMTDQQYQSVPYYANLRQAWEGKPAAKAKILEKGMQSR